MNVNDSTDSRVPAAEPDAAPRRVVLVTGGSRGIGRAVTIALVGRGCHVVVNYRSGAEAAEALATELHQQAGTISLAQADVADAAAVTAMLRGIRKNFGRLDAVINCAGVLDERLFLFLPMERFWEVLQVNLGGTANVCKSAMALLGKNGGRIVNLSSIAASHGTSGLAAYACSKAAVEALTKVLARELAPAKIRVNAIAPGLIQTEMTEGVREVAIREESLRRQPVARIGRAQEVANLAVYLALDAPDYLTGEVIRLDGGAAIA